MSFAVKNLNENSILFELFSKDILLKQEICEGKYSKEISFVISKQFKISVNFLMIIRNSTLIGVLAL